MNENKKEYNFGNLNTAEILDTTIDIYKKSFVSNLMFSIATGIIAYIVFLVGTLLIGGSIFFAYTLTEMSPITIILIIIGTVLLIGMGCCLMAISTSGSVIFSKQVILTGKSDFSLGFKRSFKSFKALASALLLSAIIFLPIFIIITLVYVYFISNNFSIIQFENSVGTTGFLVYTLIYTLTISVVFSFLYVKFVPLASVCILEKKYFLSAIKRSFELTKGSYWKILGTLLLNWLTIAFLTYGIMLLLTSLGSLISYFAGFGLDSDKITLIVTLCSNIVSPVLSIVIAPIGNIIYTVIYYNQRIKNDGYDVIIELEKLTIKHRQKLIKNSKKEVIPIKVSNTTV